MDKGDIILVPFPFSDLTSKKKRPALIISNKTKEPGDYICCAISTNKRNSNDIQILPTDLKEGKTPKQSFIRTGKISTLNKEIIERKVAKITNKKHQEIIDKITKNLSSD